MLTRSLFFQLIPPYLLAVFVLTFIMSMDTVYKLINLIVSRGVDVGSVGRMLLYRMPQFLSVTLPIAVVIAVVVVLVRLSSDLEITAMRASGVSAWQLAKPVLLFGVLATTLDLSITLWAQPAGYAAYEAETIKLLKSQTAKTVKPGVLNFDFNGKVLYVEEKTEDEELRGVFITDRELRPNSLVSLSNSGRIVVRDEEQDVLLHLKQGEMHTGDEEGGYRILQFEEFQYQFRPPAIADTPDRKVWGISTLELLERTDLSAQREMQLRLTTPFACLAFALATIGVGMVDPRRGRSNAYLQALALVVAHYILWSMCKELTTGKDNQTPLVLWIPPVCILCFGLYQLQRINRNWPGPVEWLISQIYRPRLAR
jgi:lipopolysaccharide export system permease protein